MCVYIFAFAFKQHWGNQVYACVFLIIGQARRVLFVSSSISFPYLHTRGIQPGLPSYTYTHTLHLHPVYTYIYTVSILATNAHNHAVYPSSQSLPGQLNLWFGSCQLTVPLGPVSHDPCRVSHLPCCPVAFPTLAFSQWVSVLEGFSGQPAPPAVS